MGCSWLDSLLLLKIFAIVLRNQIFKDSAAKQAAYYIVEQSDWESSLCWRLISHVNTFVLLPARFPFPSLPPWNLEIKFHSCQVPTYSSAASQDGFTTSTVNWKGSTGKVATACFRHASFACLTGDVGRNYCAVIEGGHVLCPSWTRAPEAKRRPGGLHSCEAASSSSLAHSWLPTPISTG